MPKFEDRPNLYQRTLYFNRTLDATLLDHLMPFYDCYRGNTEAIRLMKLGLQAETAGATVGAIYRPPAAAKPVATPARPRRAIVATNEDVQEAQKQAFLDFGGFPED